jgi:hypothetical protein
MTLSGLQMLSLLQEKKLEISQEMSFFLDPPLLLLIGLLVGKVNYLTIIFDDRFFTRGKRFDFLPTGHELFLASGWKLLVIGLIVNSIFWSYSSLRYIDVIYFPWPLPKLFDGSYWMLNSGLPLGLQRTYVTDISAVIIFASYPFWYYLGTQMGLAGMKIREKQRLNERDRIMAEVLRTAISKGGIIPISADDVNALGSVKDLFEKVPSIFSTGLTIILFVFDSHFIVFALTGRWKRFVDLDADEASTREKRKYMEAWESNPHFLGIIQVLKLVACFGYYTKKDVWKYIGYQGPLRPNEPPWYNPGPSRAISPNEQTGEPAHDN